MDRELVRRLLLYIVDQLQDMEAPIATIRLVKFLYLIDLEYYNQNYKTLTGIDWIKYDYGPYFFAWSDVVCSTPLDLETEEVMTKRGPGVTFRVFEEQDISDIVPFFVQATIDRILKQWAYEDLSILLEHVYETLPTKHGIDLKPLDFTLETDHLLLEHALETETDFFTIDELIADYEEHVGNNG